MLCNMELSFSSDLKKMKEDYTEYLGHVREQNEIIRNLQLLQDETQLGFLLLQATYFI